MNWRMGGNLEMLLLERYFRAQRKTTTVTTGRGRVASERPQEGFPGTLRHHSNVNHKTKFHLACLTVTSHLLQLLTRSINLR